MEPVVKPATSWAAVFEIALSLMSIMLSDREYLESLNLHSCKSETVEGYPITHYENQIITLTHKFAVLGFITIISVLALSSLIMLGLSVLVFLQDSQVAVELYGATILLWVVSIWGPMVWWKKFIIVLDCNRKLLVFSNLNKSKILDSGIGEISGIDVYSRYKAPRYAISVIGQNGRCDIARFYRIEHAHNLKLHLSQLLHI